MIMNFLGSIWFLPSEKGLCQYTFSLPVLVDDEIIREAFAAIALSPNVHAYPHLSIRIEVKWKPPLKFRIYMECNSVLSIS